MSHRKISGIEGSKVETAYSDKIEKLCAGEDAAVKDVVDHIDDANLEKFKEIFDPLTPDQLKGFFNSTHNPLAQAIKKGCPEIVELFIDKGANLLKYWYCSDGNQYNALHFATRLAKDENSKHFEILKLLLDKGADVNTTLRDEGSREVTSPRGLKFKLLHF